MKIGVSIYSFRRLLKNGMSYFEACNEAKRMGYEGVDFTDLLPEHGDGRQTTEELAIALKEHCEAIELPIVSYTIGADFLNGLNCAPEDEPARVKKCVDIAALLGAQVMRHDAFWKMPGIRDWQEAVEKIVPAVREVAQYAAERGIRTCSENHGMIMQDAARMEYMIRKVGHENYGWLVDIGNFMCADEDPQYAVGVAAPYAVHVHVKDFIFKNGNLDKPEGAWITTRGGNFIRGTVVGDGVVPVKACMGILKRAGYEGYAAVEFEGAEETLPALQHALAFLRRTDA